MKTLRQDSTRGHSREGRPSKRARQGGGANGARRGAAHTSPSKRGARPAARGQPHLHSSRLRMAKVSLQAEGRPCRRKVEAGRQGAHPPRAAGGGKAVQAIAWAGERCIDSQIACCSLLPRCRLAASRERAPKRAKAGNRPSAGLRDAGWAMISSKSAINPPGDLPVLVDDCLALEALHRHVCRFCAFPRSPVSAGTALQ